MNKKVVIEVNRLRKKFKSRVVLNNINLKVYQGEVFGLLGPNGSGKSVLIQTLLGIVEPDSGRIKILGKDLKKNSSAIHQEVNLASAYSNLQVQFNIIDNLKTFAALYGIKDPMQKITQLVAFFGLDKLAKQNSKSINLSSGENTRLLLCKALINDPKILFLDEPNASLDPLMTKKVQNLILKFRKNKSMTIFYSSHDLAEVKRICTRICFIKNGKILKITDVKNLKSFIKLY